MTKKTIKKAFCNKKSFKKTLCYDSEGFKNILGGSQLLVESSLKVLDKSIAKDEVKVEWSNEITKYINGKEIMKTSSLETQVHKIIK